MNRSMTRQTRRIVRWLCVLATVAAIVRPDMVRGQRVDRGVETDSAATRGGQPAETQTLTLQEAISRAVELNTRLKRARVEQSIAERNVSLGNAGFLPELNAVGVQRHQFGGQGLFGSGAIFTQTEAGLQLSWVAFDGLRRVETYDRLEAEERRERLRTRAEMESVVEEVTQAYIEVQRARGVLEALIETRELSKERLRISQARRNAGTGSKVDVNQAKVELNGDRSAIASQRVVVRQAETQLMRAMGRQPSGEFEVADDIDVDHGLKREELRSVMLEDNYAYRAEKAAQRITEETLAEEKARRWPQLDMGLGYTYTEFHAGIAPEFDAEASLAYNLQLTVPIFRGFNIRRSIRNARSRVAQQDFTVHRQRLLLVEQFEQAWTSYERHRERIELAKESVGLAESNVEVALTQFEAGTIDQVQLRQVQVNLQEARTRLVEARYAARAAELRLMALTGQLYDRAVAAKGGE